MAEDINGLDLRHIVEADRAQRHLAREKAIAFGKSCGFSDHEIFTLEEGLLDGTVELAPLQEVLASSEIIAA